MTNISNMDDDDDHSYASSDSFGRFPKRYECKLCNRKYITRFNLERHIDTLHRAESEDTTSDSIDDESDKISTDEEMCVDESSNDDETSSDGGEEISDDESSSDGEEEEEDENLPEMFPKLLCEVIGEHEDELGPIIGELIENNMTRKEAIKRAYLQSDAAKKTLRHKFTANIINMKKDRRHSLIKAIMEKAKEFMDEGLDEIEAITAAVGYRKHALYNLVNNI